MNHSKLYVPDPNVWIHFFKSTSHKKNISQKGGNSIHPAEQSIEPMNVELVSPVEAADERTQSTIKRLKKKTKPIRQSQRKPINRKTKLKPSIKRNVAQSTRQETVKRTAKSTKKKSERKPVPDIFSK